MRITWSAKGKQIDMVETLKRDGKEIGLYAGIGVVIGVVMAVITGSVVAGCIGFVLMTVLMIAMAPKEGYVEKKDEP
jgi:hypothetical protein